MVNHRATGSRPRLSPVLLKLLKKFMLLKLLTLVSCVNTCIEEEYAFVMSLEPTQANMAVYTHNAKLS